MRQLTPSGVPTGKNPRDLNQATKRPWNSSPRPNDPSVFMARWTTAVYHSHSDPRDETATSASQFEVHLQATLVNDFPEYHDMVERLAYQRTGGAHNNVPDDSSSKFYVHTSWIHKVYFFVRPRSCMQFNTDSFFWFSPCQRLFMPRCSSVEISYH
jgi:hypothetical protein